MKENITNRSSTKKEERLGLLLWFRITQMKNWKSYIINTHFNIRNVGRYVLRIVNN